MKWWCKYIIFSKPIGKPILRTCRRFENGNFNVQIKITSDNRGLALPFSCLILFQENNYKQSKHRPEKVYQFSKIMHYRENIPLSIFYVPLSLFSLLFSFTLFIINLLDYFNWGSERYAWCWTLTSLSHYIYIIYIIIFFHCVI